jgi:hypothetical protein
MVRPNSLTKKPKDDRLYDAKIISISKIFDMALIKENGFRPSKAQVSWMRVDKDLFVGLVRPNDVVLYGGYDMKPITDIDISNGKVIELPKSANPDKLYVSNMGNCAIRTA